MSGSLALFRQTQGRELKELAEEHLRHDLNAKDREVLKKAGRKVSTHVGLASISGVGLGLYCAYRLRTMRLAYFQAFKAIEKPVEVRFADGRTEKVPNLTEKLSPSRWGDVTTFILFSVGGLFLGGEIGLLTGTASASRTILKDPESRDRIEKALRSYKIDVLKRDIERLRLAKMPAII